jgi:NDP-hexose 2,3-enoyl reductase
MELLVAQGKVRYVGSSNFAGWHLVAAPEAAARRNVRGLVSEQCMFPPVGAGGPGPEAWAW